MAFTIFGPRRTGAKEQRLWTAKADVVQLEDPAEQWTVRDLFVNYTGNKLMLPGTMTALCQIHSVTLQIGDRQHRWGENQKVPLEIMLVLNTNPPDWTTPDIIGGTFDRFPDCLLLAGEIPLASLAQNMSDPDWRLHFAGILDDCADITAHASGLSFAGRAKLPWETAAFSHAARYHLMLPFPPGAGPLLVELDRETQTVDSISDYLTSFKTLNSGLKVGGRWANLELSNPSSIPVFFWMLTPIVMGGQPSADFQLGPGEMSLVLRGGEPNEPGSPLSTASAAVLAVFSQSVDGTLRVAISSGTPAAGAVPGGTYAYSTKNESFEFTNVRAGYDAVATASELRLQQGLASPDVLAMPVPGPPVLWGFIPLEDGWTQLPFLNLTSSIYAQAFPSLAHRDPPAPGALAGSVSFGNDYAPPPGEQPWSVTLIDADAIAGAWVFDKSLTEITATFDVFAPDLELNGFFWIGTEAPSAADALPSYSNWLTALQMVALRTVHAEDPEPSPTGAHFSAVSISRQGTGPEPTLGNWAFALEPNGAAFDTLAPLFPVLANLEAPLVWRRHPALPAVQTLPLTQSSNPPNYPSPSRELAPFQLDSDRGRPKNQSFANAAPNAAMAWPRFTGTMHPFAPLSADPRGIVLTQMVSLSVPGIAFQTDNAAIGTTFSGFDQFLGVQYRYGLPYLDEVYALSQITKSTQQTLSAAAPSFPVLTRDTFSAYWDRLAEKAVLAAAQGDESMAGAGVATVVTGLAEPMTWPVTPTWSESAYPGSLTLLDKNGVGTLHLEGDTALGGYTGSLDAQDATTLVYVGNSLTAGTFQVSGGSLAAQGSGGRIRDQRGFIRQATSHPTAGPIESLLETPLTSPNGQAWRLRTTLEALTLNTGKEAWGFWFRDLPARADDQTFLRDRSRSTAARGVNDPAAFSPEWVHLNGYEWRMGVDAAKPGLPPPGLPFLGLMFYPLTLEEVAFGVNASTDAVTVRKIQVIGRLLLPWASADLESNRANAAVLEFNRVGDSLQLVSLAAADIDPDRDAAATPDHSGRRGEWPLGPDPDSPRMYWDELSVSGTDIQIPQATLDFYLWGKRWSVPVTMTNTGGALRGTAPITPAAGDAARVDSAELIVDPANQDATSLVLNLAYEWGQSATTFLQVKEQYLLIAPKAAPQPVLQVLLANQSGPILMLQGSGGSIYGSVRVQWAGLAPGEEASAWQLLPGMHLDSGDPIRGFAAMTFAVNGFPAAHPLWLQSGFAEAVIGCEWGEMLQEPAANTSKPGVRFFGSSAGSLSAGISWISDNGAWSEKLLLNGLLEVKNLISWPRPEQAIQQPGTHGALFVIPGVNATPSPALDHARHTIRMLFDQHEVLMSSLAAGGTNQIYTFADQQGWQTLAVVEHQLADVSMNPAAPFEPGSVARDRRWTALEEVRLLSPGLFSGFLTDLAANRTTTSSDRGGVVRKSFKDASALYGGELLAKLTANPNPVLAMTESLIVEVSGAVWIRLRETQSSYSPLLFLPGVTPCGALSSLEDYSASADPAKPEWLLAAIPFLGRLQASSLDWTDALKPYPAAAPPLRIDPILQIAQARAVAAALPVLSLLLGSWEDKHDVQMYLPTVELARMRLWSRLDPASLSESWFRMSTPPREDPDPDLASVLATSPLDGPSRLGRPSALARVYETFRGSLPPSASAVTVAIAGDASAPVRWRRNQVFLFQGFATPVDATRPQQPDHDYRLFFAGATLLSAPFPAAEGEVLARYPAASLIAAATKVGDAQNPEPVSLSVSPYLGFERRMASVPAKGTSIPVLLFGELIGTQPGGQIGSLVTQLWITDPLNRKAVDTRGWACGTMERIAPDSGIAVLRVRKVLDASFPNLEKTATVAYEFQLLELRDQTPMARSAHAVRTQLQRLRFPEGQFGGTRMPAPLSDFEAAPPQVRDVQPLRLELRPGTGVDWPWGLSALRFRVRTMENAEGPAGTVGPRNGTTLWWQATAQTTQFSVGEASAMQLPPLFRAQAIGSLLPALPAMTLPLVTLAATDHPGDDAWQPILPGSSDIILDGGRPGAGFVFRHHLLRQSASDVDASGALPVQHRMPRPVPLRPNTPDGRDIALRTQASYFANTILLEAGNAPVDTAFYSPQPEDLKGMPDQRRVTLLWPEQATVPSDWNGLLTFEIDDKLEGAHWKMTVRMNSVSTPVQFARLNAGDDRTWRPSDSLVTDTMKPIDSPDLKALLGPLSHGDAVTLTVLLESDLAEVEGYSEALKFVLRLSKPGPMPLPLSPVFTYFEDPEYNRGLVSMTAKAEGVWVDTTPAPHRIRLSLDRREYNSDSQFFVVYVDEGANKLPNASLQVAAIRADGVPIPLGSRIHLEKSKLQSTSNQISIADFYKRAKPATADSKSVLRPMPGDIVVCTLYPNDDSKAAIVAVEVTIVADPVTPAPQSAYALLRKNGTSVACTRFAWSPVATRIELINPSDLLGETVRRRAVFAWTDTDRATRNSQYAIQKVSTTGSTHTIEVDAWQPQHVAK